MPQPRKRILHEITLDKVAAVTLPCQEHAVATILKTAPSEIKKAGVELRKLDLPQARGFAEILLENEQREKCWAAESAMWPLFDALRQSLATIAADPTLDPAAALARADGSVNEFIAALNSEWADVATEVIMIAKASPNADRMAAFIKASTAGDQRKDMTMATDAEKIAGLEKSLGTATADLATAMARIDKIEKAKGKPLEDLMDGGADDAMEDADGKPTKKGLDFIAKHAPAGGDETLTVGGSTISKAAVGDAMFNIVKAQQADIAKARDEAEISTLAKRASDEFGSLPGTDVEKAKVLRALKAADPEVLKTAEAIFTAAEKATKGAFDTAGTGGGKGPPSGDVKKAKQDFMAKVGEIMGRDKISKLAAMSIAEKEAPELFKEMQGEVAE